MNKRVMWITILLALILMLVMALPVKAGDGLPEGVYVFEVGDHTCVLSENDLECFCPCVSDCSESQTVLIPTDEEEKDKPKPKPTVVTTDKPKPTDEPKPEPTSEPKPEKEKCNRGKGNGPEDCDPGNSGGKPGNAGEDNEG